jgi:hypothetical protein
MELMKKFDAVLARVGPPDAPLDVEDDATKK